MASRFDSVFNTEYVSQAIPMPLDYIAQAGANKQKEYDTNKGQLNKSILDNAVKSISEHDDYRNVYLKNFNDQAQALVNDPNIDFGSFEGKQKVSNLIYQNANNPNLQVLSRSIANKKETLDNLEAIKKEKGSYGYWNDPLLKEEKLKQLGVNPYIDENGNPIEYQRQTIMRREDHFKPAEDIFKNIKDSGEINAYAGFSKDKSYIQSGKNGWEGVSPDTIMAVANRNVGTFRTTEGGQDFIRKFEFDHADELAKMPPEKAEFYKNEAIKNHLYNVGSAFVHNKDVEDVDIKETQSYLDNEKRKRELETITYPTSLSQMGERGISNMKDVLDLESSNSVLSKIINFVNPKKQAGSLLNMYKVMVPFSEYDPNIKKIENSIKSDSNLSEDKLNDSIELIGNKIKSKIQEDQKEFRNSHGFANPIYTQSASMVDILSKSKKIENNKDYDRAKEIVKISNKNFDKLSRDEQHDLVNKSIESFTEESKLNNIITPNTKSESELKLKQITSGRVIDFYTGKDVILEDVLKDGNKLEHMGQLTNDNQFGPSVEYFKGTDGKFYVSQGSLEDSRENYLDWSLSQTKNKFDKKFETPLIFDDSRDSRNFENDGVTVRSGIPKISIEEDIKKGGLNITIKNIPNLKEKNKLIELSIQNAPSIDVAKELLGRQLINAGYTADQVINLGL